MKPGQAWLAAAVRDTANEDLQVVGEAGIKLNPNWAAYGDAWWKPTLGQFGGDVGARYKGNTDIYVSGWGDNKGNWGATAGVEVRF